MHETRKIVAEFLNVSDPNEVILDSNFTTLTFGMSRAFVRTLKPGDEIVVSKLDHDSNVSPWVRAAEDVGVTIRHFDIDDGTCQLTEDNLRKVLTERTKLVAFCAASSSVGTRPDVPRLAALAHQYGALVYIDAVAYAPHAEIDVEKWDADFVGCSGYKFFGPHFSFLWARRALLEALPAYKIRPAPNTLPIKWANGAQPYELAAGVKAAIEYIAHVGEKTPRYRSLFPTFSGRKLDIHAGMAAIEAYESQLTWKFIGEIKKRPHFKIWGIAEEQMKRERLPPVAISLAGVRPNDVATYLDQHGIDVWSRSVYSISLSERLGLEGPDNPQNVGGFIRVGLTHYNTFDEIDRLVETLDSFTVGSCAAPRAAVYA
jgi:cysteine desulfurase family protein (TIGR01976 family)